MTIARSIREAGKSMLHAMFDAGQRVGIDILPRHFYSSIPDLHHLRTNSYWKRALSMTGIAGADLASQCACLEDFCPAALRTRIAKGDIYSGACAASGEMGFGVVEAAVLHSFIATKRPKRVVQVGAGVSTAIMLGAAREAEYAVDITCIDPYPSPYLVASARAGTIRLISQMAQKVELEVFKVLQEGDFLFVDSTHTVKPGSEVNRIVLEILPVLPVGVFAHFHDIHFPYDYPPSILDTVFFGLESSLLYAFLLHNARYKIAVSLSMLHHRCADKMAELIPGYQPRSIEEGLFVADGDGHFPSSTYLVAVA
jgi:hypothetical protein